ncbi:hypothetical protein RS030_192906 [Cryptosporidium xiaoi]|uniref:Uncharacterized protein n=1 Tax=Cryptosporidium xiaoi TaxID=659607 RepID=A0AAV9XYP7_9CRYT
MLGQNKCDGNDYNSNNIKNPSFCSRGNNIERNCIKIQQEYIPQILEETLSVLKNLNEILDNYLIHTQDNQHSNDANATCNCKERLTHSDEDNVSGFKHLWLLERAQRKYQIKKFMNLLDKYKHL